MLYLDTTTIVNIIEIIILFLLPVLLIYARVIPFKYRYWVLGAVLLLMVLVLRVEKWTLHDLGLRTDNFWQSLVPYFLFTGLGVTVIVVAAKLLGKKFFIKNLWHPFPYHLISVVPTCFIQELGYRAILLPKLGMIFASLAAVIIVGSLLFSLLHLPYSELNYLLPITFLGGVGFALMYIIYPNLILIFLSHLTLNFTMLLFSFFSQRPDTT
jgi:membrane protease YdiL (CAAX protease family)